MWFSGLSLTVEVYLRWKWQISPFFLSGKTWKISSVSNTYLPHYKCVILTKIWKLKWRVMIDYDYIFTTLSVKMTENDKG